MRSTNTQRWHAVDVTSGGDGPHVKSTNVVLESQPPTGMRHTGWEGTSANYELDKLQTKKAKRQRRAKRTRESGSETDRQRKMEDRKRGAKSRKDEGKRTIVQATESEAQR